jgi:hypothetical protein
MGGVMKKHTMSRIIMVLMMMATFTIGYATPKHLSSSRNIDVLTHFYSAYAQAIMEPNAEVQNSRCDSLIRIYCTKRMIKRMHKEKRYGVGFDFLTNDFDMDELSLKTLYVSKENEQYIVRYDVNFQKSDGNSVVRKVRLHVIMRYGKIANVFGIRKK